MTAEHALELELYGKKLETNEFALAPNKLIIKIPSCIEIGLHASKKGDFPRARQMFRAAIEQLDESKESQSQLTNLLVNIADTYLNEARYDSAKQWYEKALHKTDLLPQKNTLQFASIIIRLAQVNVLQNDMVAYKKCFENVQTIYLLSQEANTYMLLNALIDLSWILCVQGHLSEVQSVNDLITQIKQLEEEEKLIELAAAAGLRNR